MPDLIEMIKDSKYVDGQIRPAHYAFVFCVLRRGFTIRISSCVDGNIYWLRLYRHSGRSSVSPNANCFTAEWITTFDTQTGQPLRLWQYIILRRLRPSGVRTMITLTTLCRYAVTVWMCFASWLPGGCLNHVVLSPACSECFTLTGDGACHFAYFDALVLFIASVRFIDNGNCPCFGLIILWRDVVKI